VGGILVALDLWLDLFSGHYTSPVLNITMAIAGARFAKKNNRDVVAWVLLLALFPLPAGIVLAIIDHKRRKALAPRHKVGYRKCSRCWARCGRPPLVAAGTAATGEGLD
jgi:hypothetical protein